jgi:prevent-host-death family protein
VIYRIADAKRQFSELVKRAAYKGETVTVGARGRPEAVLISVDELRRLRELELERDARLLEEAVRRSAGTVGVAELVREWRQTYPSAEVPGPPPPSRRRASRKITKRTRR